MRNISVIFIFTLTISFAFSQKKQMENNVEELKSLSEGSLINLALTVLKEKNLLHKIYIEDYKFTTLVNENEVLVKLNHFVKYVFLGTENCHYIYDISIDMITKKVFPFDSPSGKNAFFEFNETQKKQIDFLKKATVLPYPDFENEVVETKNTFEIHITNETSIAIVSIDKVTGKQLSELNGHFSTTPPLDFSGD